jgi:hypothetical protein
MTKTRVYTTMLFACVLAALLGISVAHASETKAILGSLLIESKNGAELNRFSAMQQRASDAGTQLCIIDKKCAGAIADWIEAEQQKLGTTDDNVLEKVIAVQEYFSLDKYKLNPQAPRWQYQPEEVGVDIWKNVSEFLHDGGGDCEDFAIIKAAALQALGIRDLKIVILRDNNAAEYHAVLAATTRYVTYILDNKLNTVVHDDSLFVRAYDPLYYVDYIATGETEGPSGGLFSTHRTFSYIPTAE